jgi:hypothetical protein
MRGPRRAFLATIRLLTETAEEYIQEIFLSLEAGYPANCVIHACRLVELLLAKKRQPWIGRLRDVRQVPAGEFHGPLTPVRLAGLQGPTWTTHYVACAGELAYEPLAGRPTHVSDLAREIFGRELTLEVFLDAKTTEELSRTGVLAAAFRPRRS